MLYVTALYFRQQQSRARTEYYPKILDNYTPKN